MNWVLARRGYNGRREERKVYNFPEGFDIVDSSPDRIAEENMTKTRRLTSNPPPKKRKAEVWTLEDLQSYRKYFGGEDVVISKPDLSSSPASLSGVGPKRSGRPPKLEIGRAWKDTGEINGSIAAVADAGPANFEGKIDRSSALELSSINFESLQKKDILEDPDIEEPQSIQDLPTKSESDPESNTVVDILEDLQEENVAEISFRADMDPEILSQESDEELEHAMQYFNLGMWDRPWRPLPPADGEEELEKHSEEELSKHLELSKEKVEFNRTIHILGLGTAGKYIAHSIASTPHGPPVTLLMHRPLVMQQWHDEGAAIRILKNGEFHVQTGFHIESSANFPRKHSEQRFPGFGPNLEHTTEPPSSVIDSLIVTTDPNTTLAAISSIRHRLRKSTTICFIQDGLGILEQINQTIFPDFNERPTYVLGRMTHKLASTERHFTIVRKKSGSIYCSKLPQVVETKDGDLSSIIKREDFSWSPQAQHLVGTLIRAHGLNGMSFGHKRFFRKQLQKVVVGATIGPLSVAFDCSNDQLLYNYNVSRIMRPLLQEISLIIQALPELQAIHNIEKTFGVEKLHARVISSIEQTGKNVSSMLQDVRNGNKTDIDFYNGYLVHRAMELGIDCSRNQMLLHLVKGRQAIKNRMKNMYIPFRDEY